MKTVNVMRRLGSLAGLASVIALAGAAAVSAQPPASPKPPAEAIPRAPVKVEGASPQGYSVVLVLGDMQGTSATDGNVPAAARKALADMKDFLPYKSYRLLDAQWILGSQKTISRLRGANDLASALPLEPQDAFPKVFATSRMIALMEIAAARVLHPCLGDGELSVGVNIEVTHSAPTPEGASVSATARFVGKEGKLFVFEVTASDQGGEIGRGRHQRAIVNVDRLQSSASRRLSPSAGTPDDNSAKT